MSVAGRVRARPETGHLYFDFSYLGVRCREQTTLEDSPANQKRLLEILRRIDAEITLGSFEYSRYFPNSNLLTKFSKADGTPNNLSKSRNIPGEVTAPTFKVFSDTWFEQTKVRWRKSTERLNRDFLNFHILPVFGDSRIGSITRSDILNFRAALAQPNTSTGKQRCPKTLNHIIATLRMVLAEAALIHGVTDPSIGIKRLKVQKKDIEPFTLDEVNLLISKVRPDYRNYFIVRFFTGMRSAEINGLKWRFVDFERRQILVRETFTKGRIEYTKNDGSQREITMSSMVLEALQAQREVTAERSEYVFCDGVGHPIDSDNFNHRVWQPLLRHLELRKRRPYETRHTCATLWLAAGENPQWIASQLGHTTPEMLFRVYSRFVPNLTRKDGSAFERLITLNRRNHENHSARK